jgi:hypothetical protein
LSPGDNEASGPRTLEFKVTATHTTVENANENVHIRQSFERKRQTMCLMESAKSRSVMCFALLFRGKNVSFVLKSRASAAKLTLLDV